jgi:hypothetical protein
MIGQNRKTPGVEGNCKQAGATPATSFPPRPPATASIGSLRISLAVHRKSRITVSECPGLPERDG